MDTTKIEWADSTFNGWEGCTKVGPGCDHCYAENRNARYAGGQSINWGPGAPRRRTSVANWRKPIQWEREAAAFQAEHGRRRRVFCASLADVFDNEVDPRWREDLFALINATPSLDWLLLTKRISNVPAMVAIIPGWMPKNVWLGATIVNQVEADRDIPKLLAVPAAVHFLSMEPLLGPVDLGAFFWTCCGNTTTGGSYMGQHEMVCCGNPDTKDAIDWVIVGGESGPNARPMNPAWARDLRDQCAVADVPFLFKQFGEWAPYPQEMTTEERRAPAQRFHLDERWEIWRCGKKVAGRLLDGRTHDEFPKVHEC